MASSSPPKISERHRDLTKGADDGAQRREWFKLIAVPASLAVLGFGLGWWSERLKDKSTSDHASADARRKVYVDTSAAFASYIANWSRLRTAAQAERELRADFAASAASSSAAAPAASSPELSALRARKEKYVNTRDGARDTLLGHLEAAKINFGADVVARIDAFEKFDQANASLSMSKLAPLQEWRDHARRIFEAMQVEIKRDES